VLNVILVPDNSFHGSNGERCMLQRSSSISMKQVGLGHAIRAVIGSPICSDYLAALSQFSAGVTSDARLQGRCLSCDTHAMRALPKTGDSYAAGFKVLTL